MNEIIELLQKEEIFESEEKKKNIDDIRQG